jgi:hypothetical protein
MKMKCPICNNVGLLQQRGNSYRIQHYPGFIDEKRSYVYPKIYSSIVTQMEVNGSKDVEVKTSKTSLFSQNMWTGGDLNPLLRGDVTRISLFSKSLLRSSFLKRSYFSILKLPNR